METKEGKSQKQESSGVQTDMKVPDCGEDTYFGNNRLKGRRVLIAGGDRGIGRAVTIAMFREGADVCVSYLPSEKKDVESLKCLLEKEMKNTSGRGGGTTSCGTKFEMIEGDLKCEKFCRNLVEETKNRLEGLDTLILLGSKQCTNNCITEITTEQLMDTFQVNVFSMFHIVKAALPHLTKGSTIITTTSIEAFSGSPFLLDYSTSKGAIVSFTHSLAKQLAPKGIRVNTVAPGPIWTPSVISGGYPQDKISTFGKNTPMGRAGQPCEVAPMYVFLTSSDATFCTGETFPVTGGKHL
ncbi:hypothetical protein RB653_010233 [Dictyostelium firmibasis]|uniref:Oxidoreductase n=1 Tax=Dictyostelium firmibasis TaxID=79012 RepID=A0AAN7TTF6_9MYCE